MDVPDFGEVSVTTLFQQSPDRDPDDHQPMTLTFLAVFLRILVNPLANALQKMICSKGQSPLFANFLTYAALSLAVIPLARRIPWAGVPVSFWVSVLLVGLFGALGNGFLVRAVQSGELSVLGPINSWKSVVGIVFGVFLLGEYPGPVGLLGVFLILAGSYFVIAPGRSKEKFSWRIFRRPDLRYRIAAMVFAAIEAVFIKKIILHSDPASAFALWCWGGALFSLLLLPLQERTDWHKEAKTAGRYFLLYVALVASVGLMQGSTNVVFARIPVGYALALFQLSAVLSVFYGWFFFRESGIFRKLLASMVMVAGSALIILVD